jgi:hypothetical protein
VNPVPDPKEARHLPDCQSYEGRTTCGHRQDQAKGEALLSFLARAASATPFFSRFVAPKRRFGGAQAHFCMVHRALHQKKTLTQCDKDCSTSSLRRRNLPPLHDFVDSKLQADGAPRRR